ncbi:hypothetical protein HY256_03825, partial [Candidatus Sumerlaeota bacterium]|nr:hypothetical protein [Candidatus Sumerlaeota bacterium]
APFLIENRKWVPGVSAAVIVIGLAFCFFGWKFFKFATILGGILSGGVLGLALGGLIAAIIAQALPGEFAQWGGFVLFLLIGIPAAIYGARFGRRFAMFGARMQTLRGLDSGWMDALFALARYAFFDLSVIWGHALFGAILIIPGLYCAVVSLFALPDEHLRLALLASVVVGCSLCVYGAVSQINSLRSEPKSEFPGDY